MSVNSFREFMEKSGCRWVLAIISALIIAAFVLPRGVGCGDPNQVAGQQVDTSAAVATVGEVKVTSQSILNMFQQQKDQIQAQMQQYGLPAMDPAPAQQASYMAEATRQQINGALIVELAREQNITLNEELAEKIYEEEFQRGFETQKATMVANKQLPANPTPEQIDEALKKQGQKPVAEQKEQGLQALRTALNGADRPRTLTVLANLAVMDKFSHEIQVSDDQLKKWNDTFTSKRVNLRFDKNPNVDLEKKLEGIKQEIESGKLTFEEAMNKYSNDTPDAKKKVSENINTFDRRTLTLDKSLSPLLKLEGTKNISDPITDAQGVSIYRITEVKSTPMPDFDKNKESLAKSYKQDLAAQKLQDRLEEMRKSDMVKWTDPVFEVLALTAELDAADFRTKTAAEKKARYKELYDRAVKGSEETKDATEMVIALAQFGPFNLLYADSTEAEKLALRPERIKVLTNVVQAIENIDMRLELADLYIEEKNGSAAAENLATAASNNSDYETMGQKYFSDVNAKLAKLKNLKLIDESNAKTIEDIQARWRTDKMAFDKMKADEAAAQKKADAEAKAAADKAAEQAKKDAAAKKNAPPSSTTGTTGATGATTGTTGGAGTTGTTGTTAGK